MTPSTDWKEVVAPDEAVLFERLAADLVALQRARGQKTGTTRRALHAKNNLTARARLVVLPDLPESARVGLFAKPNTYDAVVRFSNGGGAVLPDKAPDVRGIAVKVLGVEGKKVIPGMENAPTQDFLAILSASTPFRSPEEFVWVVVNSVNPATFLFKALFHLGPVRMFSLLGRLQKGLATPVSSLAANRYFSALPIRFGASAAKFSFEPASGVAMTGEKCDALGDELSKRLEQSPLKWDLRVQFFESEKTTPIEDSITEWQTPWVTVARLDLPTQSTRGPAGQRLTEWAERLSFDPWHALEELRPLGAMMRARNAAYRVSTQARGAAGEPSAMPAAED